MVAPYMYILNPLIIFFLINPWCVSQCVKSMTQPCWLKVKVTVESHGISCPLHISFKPGRISIKLW